MRLVLAFAVAMISTAAFSEECKIIGQIAYCHDWTKDGQSKGKANWNDPIKSYGIGDKSFNNFDALDQPVAAPSYSSNKPPAYPFGNSVDFGNGVSCDRNGVAINCK